MRILIVKLSAIGDVVQALPALEAIKKTHPESRIDWVVEEAAAGILHGHPMIDRLLVSRRRTWLKQMRGFRTFGRGVDGMLSFLRELRAVPYDMAIDLQGLLKSGVLMAAARAERRIGFGGGRELSSLFLNEKLPRYDIERHALERYLDVARYLGARDPSPTCTLPIAAELPVMRTRMAAAREGGRKVVVMNPVARWTTKLWEEGKFAALADRVAAELQAAVLFTGSPDDRAAVERIRSRMTAASENWAGRTSLKELAALASLADVFVTTDTGPMHLAAAAGAKVVALFGPTSPGRTGPFGRGHAVVRTGISCSPCFRRTCGHLTCMKGIGVDEVLRAVRDALAIPMPQEGTAGGPERSGGAPRVSV